MAKKAAKTPESNQQSTSNQEIPSAQVIEVKEVTTKALANVRKSSNAVAQRNNQNSPDSMISMALQSGRSMDEIGKLIDFRNAEIARLAKLDFIDAKSDFLKLRKRIVKSNEADFGKTNSGKEGAKYKYEDLDAVDEAVRESLGDCGLNYDWKTTYDGDWIHVTCILSHRSGHSETETMRGKSDVSGGKNAIQAEASTISYLRRYTLKGVLGLSSGKDDNDGQGGAAAQRQQSVDLGLQKPTTAQITNLIKSTMAGKTTTEELKKQYELTDDDVNALTIAENAFKAKQSK